MPNEEIEAKYLQIDRDAIIQKLEELNAQKQFEIVYRRKVFDYADLRLDKDNSWLRLRDEGDRITLTFKRRLGVTDNQTGFDDAGMEETEIEVSDFDQAAEILIKTGLELKHYAENKRTRYLLDGVEVDIDEWPLIPTYLEIEGFSWDEIDKTATMLGFTPDDKVICSAHQIYARQGIIVNEYQFLTFDQQIKHKKYQGKLSQ